MKHYDIMIFGCPNKSEHIYYDGSTATSLGGPVIFSVGSAVSSGNSVCAVTKYAPEDKQLCDTLPLLPEDIYYRPSEKTMAMRSTFFTPDKERRRTVAVSMADPFTPADIPGDASASVYQLATLMFGDTDPALITALAARGPVALDVQGLLRCPDETGEMVYRDWTEKKKYFPYVTYLKTDAAEAEVLTGLSDRYEAAKMIHSWGPKEVMVSHNTEMLVFDGREFAVWPVKARNFSGRSGRGDTTTAAYITERRRKNMSDALRYATAAVSLKMETPGPLRATRAEIEAYMEEFLPLR